MRADRPRQPGQAPAPPAWRRWLGRLPRPCALCSQWDTAGFCSDCRQRFVAAAALPRCPRCALPSPGGSTCGTTCGACLREPPAFSHCQTLADYAFPWDRLVMRLKFQQQPELAGLLAAALAEALQQQPALPRPHWVLPVPLSPARLAERGYNQAWELARRLAARQGLPARADWLQRLRDTPHQVGLGRRARTANLHGAMWVPPEAQRGLAGCQLALVDDVMTTGVTAAAASQALLAAGAAGVQVWVLARTPAPAD
jgi:ComF family protein